MSDYYIGIDYNGDPYISHVSKADHKYIAKVYLGNGLYRYFYSVREYNAYLYNKRKQQDNIAKAESMNLASTYSYNNEINKTQKKMNNLLEVKEVSEKAQNNKISTKWNSVIHS